MRDSRKTKKQLIEELNALRNEKVASIASGKEAEKGGMTRREILSAWVAPVILAVPMAPRMALAQDTNDGDPPITAITSGPPLTVSPTAPPTAFPPPLTVSPTAPPTAFPPPLTVSPTAPPTAFPPPLTVSPTAAPTVFPTAAPTAFPTAAPTQMIPVEISEFDVE